jgi:hypothetical protein
MDASPAAQASEGELTTMKLLYRPLSLIASILGGLTA